MKNLLLAFAAIFACNFTVSPCVAQVNGGDRDRKNMPEHEVLAEAVPEPNGETNEIYIVLKQGVDPQDFAAANGLVLVKSSPALTGRNSHVFAADNAEVARTKLPVLSARASVKEACMNRLVIDAIVHEEPNDPYFGFISRFGGQWTMADNIPSSSVGVDSALLGAWSQGYTGNGITIGVMDHGVETTHPDLAPRYLPALSFDYFDNDSNPNPVFAGENHGTAVAGICAAAGNNGIGVTGAAPGARFAAMRPGLAVRGPDNMVIEATVGDSQSFIDSIVHGGSSIDIKNHSWGRLAPFNDLNIPDNDQDTLALRNAFSEPNGQIHVAAAGNERYRFNSAGDLWGSITQDAGKCITCTAGSNIVVGAIGDDGKFAQYSSFGSVLICSAPSGGGPAGFGVTTTDRTGAAGYNVGNSYGDYSTHDGVPNSANYTAGFSGTSAAAPLVSGILALAMEANPVFNRHNIGHLIVRSCDIVDPSDPTTQSDGGWRTNGGGFAFNQNYGFGKLNAAKIVSEAQRYAGTTGSGFVSSNSSLSASLAIPDGGTLTHFFSFPAGRIGNVTQLELRLGVTHARRGDLTAYITSPSGFRSRLFQANNRDNESDIGFQFPFRMLSFWGEDYEGTWKLELTDIRPGISGTLNIFTAGTNLSELIPISRPTNDDLENAIELTSLEPDTGSNVRATTEPYESDVTEFRTRRSVWWKGTATITGFLNVDTFGSDFDTVLHVYRSPTGLAEDLVLLDRDDDSGGTFQSFVRVPVVAGDEIAIRVAGFDGRSGAIQVTACGIGPKILVNGNDLIVRGGNGNDDIFVAETVDTTFVEINGNLQTYPGIYDVTVLGFDGNDTITSSIPRIIMNGMDGNDTITFTGTGVSELIGGNGDDTIRGGSGPDVIFGGADDDLIIGRAGNDTMYGGTGDDEMRGISGRNLISGGSGNNELYGGTGPDEIIGGIGDDVIFGGNGADDIRGGAGLNVIDGGLASDHIIGGSGRDEIRGGPGNDTIYGLAGNDELLGDAGSDEIIGGPGNDLILGGPGLDRLYGQAGDDVLHGETSADFLVGGGGNDELDGGSGPDELFGGGGSDVLTGGDGFDALHGGQGNDTATDEGEAAETSIEN